MNVSWADLAFASKKPVNDLDAIFVLAPRELSTARFKQLIKTYLPKANLLLGVAQEDYVLGFEDQPQFRMLGPSSVQSIIDKVNASNPPHTVSVLQYAQRDAKFLLEKLSFKEILLFNGSWKYVFHSRPEYYTIANAHTPYTMVSPFTGVDEARAYANSIHIAPIKTGGLYNDSDLMDIAQRAAKQSFDYNMQTGVALSRRKGDQYQLIATSYNGVVPYQTFAMHHGAAREKNFSPMHDLNHYDTNHAEVEMVIKAQKQQIDLHGTTLFINLLPCPTCARMFARTDIEEFVYLEDHSDGYATRLLSEAGKTVRRL
ncbi:MAG TPA: deaminase [Candidatus Saccharimonadia bacterium]|nr:deaminase [Candidatus Saccharimonadia bacterium]